MYEELEQKIQKNIDENLESIDEIVLDFVDSDGRSDVDRRYMCDMLTILSNERRRLFDLRDMLEETKGDK